MAEIDLLLSSGSGPAECRIALSRCIEILAGEAGKAGCLFEVTSPMAPDKYGPKSALVTLQGENAGRLALEFCGTVRFVFKSPLRPQHKRQNWFIAVSRVERPDSDAIVLAPHELRFETMRAGGPGGQHQNTTDSAVRVLHVPSGIQVTARNERSQHRNKVVALQRLAMMLQHVQDAALAEAKAARHHDNRAIERGNAVKSFRL